MRLKLLICACGAPHLASEALDSERSTSPQGAIDQPKPNQELQPDKQSLTDLLASKHVPESIVEPTPPTPGVASADAPAPDPDWVKPCFYSMVKRVSDFKEELESFHPDLNNHLDSLTLDALKRWHQAQKQQVAGTTGLQVLHKVLERLTQTAAQVGSVLRTSLTEPQRGYLGLARFWL